MNIEGIGQNFSIDKFFKARALTIQATHTISKKIETGMNESDGKYLIDTYLKEIGSERLWHPTKFRIGTETKKIFREKPDQEIRLKKEDIFFIDIGPVFEGHEADYGETFAIGNSFQKLAADSKKVFEQVAQIWKVEKISGIELYKRASEIASTHGYSLANQKGHRLGDYPHAIHYKGNLGSVDFPPSPNLWILEIHLLKHAAGSFFEDILL